MKFVSRNNLLHNDKQLDPISGSLRFLNKPKNCIYKECLCLTPSYGFHKIGGGERVRTDDLLLAKQALSQLSYTPKVLSNISKLYAITMVGPGRLELPTSRLSGVRSNQAELRALIN